jgi:N-acetylglucosamine-6-sulfatase
LLHGEQPAWRALALIEHTYDPPTNDDPDSQTVREGDPPSYDAVRTPGFTFVRYRADGSHEYYDLRTDPEELHNAVATLPPGRVAELDRWLHALTSCHDAASCWLAGRPTGAAP